MYQIHIKSRRAATVSSAPGNGNAIQAASIPNAVLRDQPKAADALVCQEVVTAPGLQEHSVSAESSITNNPNPPAKANTNTDLVAANTSTTTTTNNNNTVDEHSVAEKVLSVCHVLAELQTSQQVPESDLPDAPEDSSASDVDGVAYHLEKQNFVAPVVKEFNSSRQQAGYAQVGGPPMLLGPPQPDSQGGQATILVAQEQQQQVALTVARHSNSDIGLSDTAVKQNLGTTKPAYSASPPADGKENTISTEAQDRLQESAQLDDVAPFGEASTALQDQLLDRSTNSQSGNRKAESDETTVRHSYIHLSPHKRVQQLRQQPRLRRPRYAHVHSCTTSIVQF